MPERVRITDVAPRDGLQNEPGVIPVADKVRLVQLLAATGVDEVEIGSFVAAKWVPQMAGTAEVCAALAQFGPLSTTPAAAPDAARSLYSALVPNERGMEAALAANAAAGWKLIGKVSVFTAASEEFARRNTNATIAETIERFKSVARLAHDHGLLLRGYVSCVIACPFAGPTAPAAVAEVSARLLEIGVDELDWGDTIGAATPETLENLLAVLSKQLPANAYQTATLHLHDTFGRAAACIPTALRLGLRSFDGAAGGLGGCPYASRPGRPAPGNLATETLVQAVRAAGFATGVDPQRLADAGAFAAGLRSAAALPG